jgi:hypothetical protein
MPFYNSIVSPTKKTPPFSLRLPFLFQGKKQMEARPLAFREFRTCGEESNYIKLVGWKHLKST